MIRKVYLLMCFMVVFKSSNSQGASIVYDPTNGAQIASMLSSIKELKEGADEWKANSEFIDKLVSQGPEVKRLLMMLEGIFCATEELELLLQLSGGLEGCGEKLELDITLMNVEGISGKLKWIATGGILMTQYETMQSLKDLNDQLEKSVRYVNNMNRFLRDRVMNKLLKEYDAEHGGENMSFLTPMNL
jgi:hypothetical protein